MKNKKFIYNLILISTDTINSIIKMLTNTQYTILKFLLKNQEEQITIRGLSKKLSKSYTLVYNNLKDLEEKNIIKTYSIPPAKIVSLNEFAPFNILIDTELKIKEEFLIKHPWLRVMLNDIFLSIKDPFFIFIVFGSYVKEKQTKNSDMDILIIAVKNKIKEIEDVINQIYTKVKKNIIFIDTNNFIEMISQPNKLNIGNEAKKHHIILHGVEQYYQLIKK